MSCSDPCLFLLVSKWDLSILVSYQSYRLYVLLRRQCKNTHTHVCVLTSKYLWQASLKSPAVLSPVILQELHGWSNREGVLLFCPMGHHRITSPLKGPASLDILAFWLVSDLEFRSHFRILLVSGMASQILWIIHFISRPLFPQKWHQMVDTM